MYLLTLNQRQDNGAYAVLNRYGEKVLFMFEEEDDAERYKLMLESDEDSEYEVCEGYTVYPETLFDGQFFIKLPSDKNLSRELIQDSKMVFNDILWWEKNGIPNTSIIWKGRSRRVIGSLEILRGWRKQ